MITFEPNLTNFNKMQRDTDIFELIEEEKQRQQSVIIQTD